MIRSSVLFSVKYGQDLNIFWKLDPDPTLKTGSRSNQKTGIPNPAMRGTIYLSFDPDQEAFNSELVLKNKNMILMMVAQK